MCDYLVVKILGVFCRYEFIKFCEIGVKVSGNIFILLKRRIEKVIVN